MLHGLIREAVAIVDTVSDKEEALSLLVSMTCEAQSIDYVDEILDAVLERESSLSTGIGLEIAVPHCRNDKLTNIINGALLVTSGVNYNAVDGKPVRLMFFIASPSNDIQGHLSCLSEISHAVADEDVRKTLLSCHSADNLFDMLTSIVT